MAAFCRISYARQLVRIVPSSPIARKTRETRPETRSVSNLGAMSRQTCPFRSWPSWANILGIGLVGIPRGGEREDLAAPSLSRSPSDLTSSRLDCSSISHHIVFITASQQFLVYNIPTAPSCLTLQPSQARPRTPPRTRSPCRKMSPTLPNISQRS